MIRRRTFIAGLAGLGSAVAWEFGIALSGANAMNDASKDDFRAWYEPAGGGKIVVVGKVTETDGSTIMLVRAEPQGINPLILMLRLQVEPYKGQFHPHTAIIKELCYEEPAARRAFTDVYIERQGGGIELKVEDKPK
jgi:hypothetical protein